MPGTIDGVQFYLRTIIPFTITSSSPEGRSLRGFVESAAFVALNHTSAITPPTMIRLLGLVGGRGAAGLHVGY
jgi:hypothetical protein